MAFDQDKSEFYGELDHPAAHLCGHALGVIISKQAQESEPLPETLEVLDSIIDHLDSIRETAEKAVLAHLAMPAKEASKLIGAPVIWIDGAGEIHRLAEKEWTLLVASEDNQHSGGWHLDFRGNELLELWEGEAI